MSKVLKLNTSERLAAIAALNSPNNKISVENLKAYYEDAAKFGLSEEDKAKNQWEEIKDEQGQVTSVKWNDAGNEPKEIEISDFTEKFLNDTFPKLEYSPTDPLAPAAASLLAKLKE